MNLRALLKPIGREFAAVLESAPDVLTQDESNEFFKITLGLFKTDIKYETGVLILRAIRKVIENPQHMKLFASGKFLVQLPFHKSEFCDGILDVIHIVVETAPRSIDARFVAYFLPCIEENSVKCLILIALYSVHFSEVDNPWPFLDLLFKQAQVFTAPETIRNYCTVLCYLCSKFEAYRTGRLQHCWVQINACLSSSDTETLCASYDALCFLSKYDIFGLDVDFDAIKRHLRSPTFCQHALSLLASIQIPDEEKTPAFIQALLVASTHTEKGTLVLLELLQDDRVATYFVDSTSWMLTKIPKIVDTLRVCLVVFRRRELRERFSDVPEIVPFLKTLIEQANMGMISIVGTIIRRMELSEAQIKDMSKRGLFKMFFSVAYKLNDDISMDAAFMLAHHISRICFIPELESFADKIADCAMSEERLARTACFVAAELSRHEPCYCRMATDGLRDFFEDNINDPKLKSFAERFLANKRATVKKPRRLRPL